MAPRLTHVLETSLYVAELDRSRAFYQRLLGSAVLLADARMVALELPGPSVLLLFRRGGSDHPSPTPGGVIPPHGGSGEQHLCFGIPVAALEEWERHLAACGVAVESRVVQAHGGISLYFRDPDLHSVELATPGLWANY